MKCKRCKKNIPDDSKFCSYCGVAVEKQHLTRRADGRYAKTIMVNGKRKTFYGKNEKEINKKMIEYNKMEEQKKILPFNTVVDEWEKETYQYIAYNTEKGYRPKATRAKEYFDDMPLNEISIKDINKYINQFPKTWAFKTVNGYYSVLNLIFSFACRNGYIENNPCQYVKLPKGLKRTHRRAPTEDEIKKIENSLDVQGGVIAYFFLYSGLRRGEALALRWSDIDFKNKVIKVNKSVYWVSNSPHIKEPKTEKGNREVVLLDCLEKILKPLKTNKDDLVFGDNGELFTNKRFCRQPSF